LQHPSPVPIAGQGRQRPATRVQAAHAAADGWPSPADSVAPERGEPQRTGPV